MAQATREDFEHLIEVVSIQNQVIRQMIESQKALIGAVEGLKDVIAEMQP